MLCSYLYSSGLIHWYRRHDIGAILIYMGHTNCNKPHQLRHNEMHQRDTLEWRHNEVDCISNHQRLSCLLNSLFRRRLNKISKPRVTGLCEGNLPMISGFPSQKISNAENVSIWWRHHDVSIICHIYACGCILSIFNDLLHFVSIIPT